MKLTDEEKQEIKKAYLLFITLVASMLIASITILLIFN